MQSLEKRIAALEAARPAMEGEVIFLSFVTMDETDKEIYKVCASWVADEGRQWTRESGETEDEFKERVSREVQRNPHGVTLLYSHGE